MSARGLRQRAAGRRRGPDGVADPGAYGLQQHEGEDRTDHPEPHLRHERQADPERPADHPGDLERRLGPGEHAGPHRLGDVALDRGIGVSLLSWAVRPATRPMASTVQTE